MAGAASAAVPAAAPTGRVPAVPGCREFAGRLPNLPLRLCEQAGLQAGSATSAHGTPLYVRDLPATGARLRVLVVGAIHGDELSAGALAFHWLALARERQGAPLPQPVHWRFIPVLNPDGALARPPRRTNANGVDLNRNFPTPDWERAAASYWEQRTRRDPRRWPGPRPLSEPESRFLHEQLGRFRPHLIVAIHAPYGLLDFDGPSVPPAHLGRLQLDQVGIFPGSLGHYGGVHQGVPVVTIELPNALRTPLDAEMRQMWLDLLRWMGDRLVAGGLPAR
nr:MULTISPECIES: M14 family zinc carboxypeptidase [Ramlibacter]